MSQQTEQATTERMGVNPLAVIRAHAESHRSLAAVDAYSAQEAPKLEAALAAVAELASAGKRVTDAFRVIGNDRTAGLVPHGLRIEAEQAMLALDAALAPFSEAQS